MRAVSLDTYHIFSDPAYRDFTCTAGLGVAMPSEGVG